MDKIKKDLVIIGGGPAGLAAAVSAYDNGLKDIVIIERDSSTGGVLQQCIHNGFGLTRFKENLTGPEYAARFFDEVSKRKIEVMNGTSVLDLSRQKVVTATNAHKGIFEIEAKSVILAMGCRERSKGALNIAGFRPSGLFSAGTAQRYVNILGQQIGGEVVILGSGDIGLIMARRMTLEGAKVRAVLEIMPHSSGLRRNIAQCLDDYDIPLYLNHTITNIHGRERVEGVTIAEVDGNKNPIKESEQFIKCDTVLFSVGLLPENELTRKADITLSSKTRGAVVDQYRQTDLSGVFACGNVLQVHDLVDFVSEEAEIAGRYAAKYVLEGLKSDVGFEVTPSDNVSYVVPQKIYKDGGDVKLYFRPMRVMKNAVVEFGDDSGIILKKKKLAAAPGEMETAVLKGELINSIRGGLRVSMREE